MRQSCAAYLKEWLDAIDGDEKFVMTVGAGVVNAIFLACGILSETGYLTILGSTIFAYITGKVVEDRHSEQMEVARAGVAKA